MATEAPHNTEFYSSVRVGYIIMGSEFRVNSDPNQLGPCYKQCPSWFTAVSDLVMVD